jgi:hypothetical protein
MDASTNERALKLPFNRVLLRVGARRRELGVRDFLAMPFAQRIEVILRRQVEFYDGTHPVSPHVALSALRRLRPER